jgi:hypothetical protein
MSVAAAAPLAAAMSVVWVGFDLLPLTECEDHKGRRQGQYRETDEPMRNGHLAYVPFTVLIQSADKLD